MQIFFEQSDRSSHEYPDQYFYLRLPWKDYRLCTKQFLPQNYHRAFPQFREMGWYLTGKCFKILRSWNYLFRSTAHRKACFLYCGWYHSFKTIVALKTNRLLYPSGMKKKLSELAAELSVTEKGFDLVTVKKRKYYVYRYEGNLNGIENAVVLLSYPEKAFGNPKALRAFKRTWKLLPDLTVHWTHLQSMNHLNM